MEPTAIVALITAGIPFVTSIFKKLFRTEKLSDKPRKGVNALIPILLGILSTGLYGYTTQGLDIWQAVALGLGSGGVASSARDIEKNLLRLVEAVTALFKPKKK